MLEREGVQRAKGEKGVRALGASVATTPVSQPGAEIADARL